MDSPAILSLPTQSYVFSMPIPTLLVLNVDALIAKEVCDLLSCLDVVIPGCDRAIACLLMGTTTKGKSKVGDCSRTSIRKEKSLTCKNNNGGTVRKAVATA